MNMIYIFAAGAILGWCGRRFWILWRAQRRIAAAERHLKKGWYAVAEVAAGEEIRAGDAVMIKDGIARSLRRHPPASVSLACPPQTEGDRK